ncbi:mucin-16-like isoform X1 [Monodelphis domestica]|uniref:mucin-16-like isoform X1 n=1 Tax=Monodelphis domestica TaxID=13616 RepID=UPI0024E1FEDD|nr:mucin-16-like isoform X1 [Monodelphis domestica]
MSFPCFRNISWNSYYKTFTLSFTITNMFYTTKMNQKDSRTFEAAEHILQILLKVLFGSSRLASQYSGCSALSLRSLRNRIATGVDILCTFKKYSSNHVLDKKVVYWELIEQLCTRKLKHLVIDNDSLIVNGYQHKLPGIRSTKRSEVGVGAVTHIPDHGAPGDIKTSLTSGLLIRESIVYSIGFPTETSGTLKKVSGSHQGREPTDSISIPMTGFKGRDSITDIERDICVMETTLRATGTQAPLLIVHTGAGDLIPGMHRRTVSSPTSPSAPSEISSGVTIAIARPSLSMTPVEPTASPGSSGPLNISLSGTIFSTPLAQTPRAEIAPGESCSTPPSLWSTSVDSFNTVGSAPGTEITSIVPLYSLPTASSATETTPNPDLSVRPITLEPGSAALTSTAPTIIPTLSEEDINTSLVSIEGPTEDKTVSSTFPANADTPGITHREHFFTGPGVTFQPDMASTSLPNLCEGISYSRNIPSPSLGSRKSSAMIGVWTNPAEPHTVEPKKPTPAEGSLCIGPVTEFSSRESGHLKNSLASAVTLNSPLPSPIASSSMDVDSEMASGLSLWTDSSSSQVEVSFPYLFSTTGDGPSLGTEPHNPIHESLSPGPGSFPALSTPTACTRTASLEAATSLEDPGPAGLTPETERNPQATPTPVITLPPASTQEVCTTASPSPSDTTTEGNSVKSGTTSVSDQVPSTSSLFPSSDAGVVPATHAQGHEAPGSTGALMRSPLTSMCSIMPTELSTSLASSMNIFDTYLPDDTIAPSDDSSESTVTSVSQPSYYKIFTLDFTITNMLYKPEMGETGSSTFEATEHVLKNLLKVLFERSSLGSQYSGCSVISLRSRNNGTATGVDVYCILKEVSASAVLEKEKVYWELTEQLFRRKLSHLIIDKDSLSVDGYNRKMTLFRSRKGLFKPNIHKDMKQEMERAGETKSQVSAAGSSNLKTFTLNFTITNMFYTTTMSQRRSNTFRATEFILQHLFKVLFERSSLGSQYSGCSVTLLRSMNNGKATGVEVICSYQEVLSIPVLDKKKIYQELSQQTNGITKLGSYILDNESLYVDGYNPQMPTLSTNRPSAESKGRIRTTDREPETIMTTTCSPAVRTHAVLATTTTPTTTSGISGLEKITVPASSALPETMVAPTAWSGVEMSPSETMLIAEISTTLPGDGTGEGVPSYPATVDPTASTTFFSWTNVPPAGSISSSATSLSSVSREDPKPILSLDTSASEITSMATAREGLALTESTATMEISRGAEAEILSTSGLPNISASPLIPKDKISTWATMTTIADTASESPYLKVFNLKFTILNLFYTTDMGQRGSSKFNSIEDVLQPLINNLFRKSSFGPHYFGCRLTLLRSMKNRIATAVDVECAYQEDSSTPVLDLEKIYWELSEQTHGKTRLGPYILHKESLYVDGYTHQIPTTTTNSKFLIS